MRLAALAVVFLLGCSARVAPVTFHSTPPPDSILKYIRAADPQASVISCEPIDGAKLIGHNDRLQVFDRQRVYRVVWRGEWQGHSRRESIFLIEDKEDLLAGVRHVLAY